MKSDDILAALTDEDRAWLREHGWKEPPGPGARELVRLPPCAPGWTSGAVWVRGLTFDEWNENSAPARRIALAHCDRDGAQLWSDVDEGAQVFSGSSYVDVLYPVVRRLSGWD